MSNENKRRRHIQTFKQLIRFTNLNKVRIHILFDSLTLAFLSETKYAHVSD